MSRLSKRTSPRKRPLDAAYSRRVRENERESEAKNAPMAAPTGMKNTLLIRSAPLNEASFRMGPTPIPQSKRNIEEATARKVAKDMAQSRVRATLLMGISEIGVRDIISISSYAAGPTCSPQR